MREINSIIGFFVRMYHTLKRKLTSPDQKKVVKLAVVGSTGCGKTYLLSDLLGALEKLGCRRDDNYNDGTLHRDAYALIENQKHNGGVDKTTIRACRQEDLYCSRFIDSLGHRMTIEFADIPGEVMTPESISMFRAVMKALMACRNKLFVSTTWNNPDTHKTVRIIELDKSGSTDNRPIVGLNGSLSSSFSFGAKQALEAQSHVYVGTSARKAYYSNQGFVEGSRRRISGAALFSDFLQCDVDSVINAIIEAWPLLKVDEVLPEALKNKASGKTLFQTEYKNHFFFHYNTFFATDVVVCDKCCTPLIGDRKEATGSDRFTVMMQVLKNLTSYKDAPAKRWYLALKGFDAVLREEKWREVYQASGQDINLVYSHFLVLFRQACEHGLLKGGAPSTTYVMPFSSADRMMAWLTNEEQMDSDEGHASGDDVLVSLLEEHYRTFANEASAFFNTPESYAMQSSYDLSEHVRRRVEDFCHVDDSLVRNDPEKQDERRLLNLPPHVYFLATPIDNQFHLCGHCAGDPTLFEGDARYYNHRAGFGSVQLATDILLAHGIRICAEYDNYGYVLNHVHDQG